MTADENLDLGLDPTKLAEAWADPDTRRMALVMARAVLRGSQREIAKALGVSIFVYYDLELGRKPLSVEAFFKAMQGLGATPEYVVKVLLITRKLLLDLADGWPKVWREQLEPLDFEARRALILADEDLHNCGLGDLLCDKSQEASDPEEAVRLAELALLTMEASRLIPDYKQNRCGYARGHLGHALLRRGDSVAAEAAFALAIEEWMSLGIGGSRHGDAREVERLASIVPGFPKAEALQKPKRARKPPKKRSK
jgi:transcriptional regulator with XRE-family HTH domain